MKFCGDGKEIPAGRKRFGNATFTGWHPTAGKPGAIRTD
jgi:hypothetical protein